MTPGEFISFLTAVGLVFQPVRGIGIIYAKMQDALAASERVFTVLDLTNIIEDGEKTLEEPIRSIRFENVSLDLWRQSSAKRHQSHHLIIHKPLLLSVIAEEEKVPSSMPLSAFTTLLKVKFLLMTYLSLS